MEAAGDKPRGRWSESLDSRLASVVAAKIGGVDMHPVLSSNVKLVGYDVHGASLYVVFRNGGRYKYTGVPQEVFDAFLGSASKGGYHAHFVKGRFPYSRI